jgi:DNA-binding response OmpR family regulator
MAEALDNTVSALLVGDFENDRLLIHEIFRKPGWKLYELKDRRKALDYLTSHPVHVVISEAETPRWNWRRILSDLRLLNRPPQLIVTSRKADDCLWAEVLNVGAFDLLLQPLDREEAERVISFARRHYDSPPRRLEAQSAAFLKTRTA